MRDPVRLRYGRQRNRLGGLIRGAIERVAGIQAPLGLNRAPHLDGLGTILVRVGAARIFGGGAG